MGTCKLELMFSMAEWILSIDMKTVTIFLLIFKITYYYFSGNRSKNFPPGPINIPLVGYLPFVIGKNMENVYNDLKKKYGDIVYFRLGTKHIVTLNSYENIKEALLLNPEVAVTRPEEFSTMNYMHDYSGHTVDNGKTFVEHRRFLMRTLRDLGMGKTTLESEIQEEATGLILEIHKNCGHPFDIQKLLTNAVANIITSLLYGYRFEYSDPEFQELLTLFATSSQRFSPLKLVDYFQYIRYILPGFMSGMAEVYEAKTLITQFLKKMIAEQTQSSDDTMQDYTNLYLRRQKEELAQGKPNTSFTDTRLRSNILTLNIAGTATVTAALYWCLKMLIRNKDIQKRLHNEIDHVIGTERVPTYSDRKNMPSTEAFFMEIQRYCDIAPIGVPHAAKSETKLAGYDIPKGWNIMTLLCFINQDPRIWGDPENFRPERFIGKDGKPIKSEYLIPFGIGKRSCPGEQLALIEVFIFVTRMLQIFEFSPATIEDAGIEDYTFAFTRDLHSFKVIIQPRHAT